ncbi:MFS transporter [Clostridium guangxiense]|uniref:MFS transporter n=1 Tax=Clostridium guangxiense TaxID=1662055 RepID=UPI001E56974B|nr:MFS transporter [Clostridium guangxiense]MCD2348811.1 MFS transporter [Clostridium guangxiense]
MCKNAKILLVVSALFTFSTGLSNIFTNVFFWRETKNLVVIAIYNLVIYLITPTVFVAAGFLSKKKNPVHSLRIGLIGYSIFYALILYIGGKGTPYIYLLGFINGIAAGFYWLPFNVLCFDFTSLNNRDTFNGLNGGFGGIASIIGPITAAYIISRFRGFVGYRIVFFISFIIFIILAFVSSIFKHDNSPGDLDMKKVLISSSEEWKIAKKSNFLWGLRDSTMMFLINILAIQVMKNELNLGILALTAALITSGSCVLVQKIIKPERRRISILIGTVGAFISTLIIVLKLSYVSIFAYSIVDAFCIPFFMIQLYSATFNVIDVLDDEDSRVEYMISRDFMLNGGRAVSVCILIVLLICFDGKNIINVYLIFLGIVPTLSGYFLKKLQKVL